MTTSALVSLAILKINFDEEGKSYIHNFVPFIAECLRSSEAPEVSVPELQACIRDVFGLTIPQGAIQTVLRRSRREGLVNIEHGVYLRNDQAVSRFDLSSKRADALRQHAKLIAKFGKYAKERHDIDLDQDRADDLLMTFVEAHSSRVLASVIRGDPLSVVPQEESRHEFLVSSFILHLYESDPAGFVYLETVVKGSMLAAALFLPSGKVEKRFQGLKLVLDTPLLLKALGFEGEPAGEAAQELLRLARELGAELVCLKNTMLELEGVLEACANALRAPRRVRDSVSPIEEYCLRERLSASDLQLAIVKLQPRMRAIGVRVTDPPEYSERLSVDENRFEDVLMDEVRYARKEAMVHDLNALTAIFRLRRDRECHELESCQAIFVTPNIAVARASLRFFGEDSSSGVPMCLVDHELTTLVWLKKPLAVPDLPKKQIIADCYAALRPGDSLWRKYLEEIERLNTRNSISEEDYFTLRFSLQARRALMDLTLGEPEAFTIGTIEDILERARRTARADLEAALEREKQERAMEQQLRQQREQEVRRERERFDLQEIRRMQQIDNQAARWANFMTNIILYMAVALFLAVTIGSRWFEGTVSIVALILAAIGLLIAVLGVLNMTVGGSVRSWLEQKVEPRIASAIVRFLRNRLLPEDEESSDERMP